MALKKLTKLQPLGVNLFFLLIAKSIFAQNDTTFSFNMRLACIDFHHISATGKQLSYENYWENFSMDGWGNYRAGSLGKYRNQKGSYTIDVMGNIAFTGFLGTMNNSHQFHTKRKNAFDKLENEYKFIFEDDDGAIHSCYCMVMGREKDSGKLPPLPSSAGGLSGIYYFWLPDTYDLSTGMKINYGYYYYFMPDGYVYKGLPEGGVDKCDCKDLKYMKNCKTYRINGGNIEISGEKAQPFVRKGNDIKIGDKSFWQIKKVTDTNLPGDYKFTWSVSGAVHYTFWKFNKDGSFKQTAIGSTDKPALFGIVINNGAKEMVGTYKINGYTLSLTYSNGEKTQHTLVHTYGDKDEITIDGNECFRIKKDLNK